MLGTDQQDGTIFLQLVYTGILCQPKPLTARLLFTILLSVAWQVEVTKKFVIGEKLMNPPPLWRLARLALLTTTAAVKLLLWLLTLDNDIVLHVVYIMMQMDGGVSVSGMYATRCIVILQPCSESQVFVMSCGFKVLPSVGTQDQLVLLIVSHYHGSQQRISRHNL